MVTDTGRRYITNLLAATASTKAEESDDSSADSDAERWASVNSDPNVSMDFVHRTLTGIATHNRDDGSKNFGRHASIIRMGCDLWQTPPLTSAQEKGIVVGRDLHRILLNIAHYTFRAWLTTLG